MNKKQNLRMEYADIVKKLQKNGIIVQAALIVGLDEDTPDTFNSLRQFIKESRTNCFQLNVLYPYPGTNLRERLLSENRITSNDWTNYMLDGINYIPKNMNQDELHSGYVQFLKKHTSIPHICKISFETLIKMGFLPAIVTASLNIGTRRSYVQISKNIGPVKYLKDKFSY